jgi:hypothetical protein
MAMTDVESPSGFSIVPGLHNICWMGMKLLLGISNQLLQSVQATPGARAPPMARRLTRIGYASEFQSILYILCLFLGKQKPILLAFIKCLFHFSALFLGYQKEKNNERNWEGKAFPPCINKFLFSFCLP